MYSQILINENYPQDILHVSVYRIDLYLIWDWILYKYLLEYASIKVDSYSIINKKSLFSFIGSMK